MYHSPNSELSTLPIFTAIWAVNFRETSFLVYVKLQFHRKITHHMLKSTKLRSYRHIIDLLNYYIFMKIMWFFYSKSNLFFFFFHFILLKAKVTINHFITDWSSFLVAFFKILFFKIKIWCDDLLFSFFFNNTSKFFLQLMKLDYRYDFLDLNSVSEFPNYLERATANQVAEYRSWAGQFEKRPRNLNF